MDTPTSLQEHLGQIREMVRELNDNDLLKQLDDMPIESPLETWHKLLTFQDQLREKIFKKELELLPILRRRAAMMLLNKYVAATIVYKLQPVVPLVAARSMLMRRRSGEPKAASSSDEEEIVYCAKKRQRNE